MNFMKKIFLNCFLITLMILCSCSLDKDIEKPPMAKVNNTLFQYSTNKEIEFDIPATGTIDTIIGNEVPAKNDEANFGEEGMEYWLVDEDKLYIELKDKILYCVPESEIL